MIVQFSRSCYINPVKVIAVYEKKLDPRLWGIVLMMEGGAEIQLDTDFLWTQNKHPECIKAIESIIKKLSQEV